MHDTAMSPRSQAVEYVYKRRMGTGGSPSTEGAGLPGRPDMVAAG